MREFIDAAVFKDIILCANAALEQNRQLINELNVFPVPDGDTGTNMSLTMGAAAAELSKKSFPTLSAAADCAASAMLRGARGIINEVSYKVSKATGVPVKRVDVYVDTMLID